MKKCLRRCVLSAICHLETLRKKKEDSTSDHKVNLADYKVDLISDLPLKLQVFNLKQRRLKRTMKQNQMAIRELMEDQELRKRLSFHLNMNPQILMTQMMKFNSKENQLSIRLALTHLTLTDGFKSLKKDLDISREDVMLLHAVTSH